MVVPPAPPRPGTSALSDHPRVETDSGWYLPMKVDHSGGDGNFADHADWAGMTISCHH